MRVTTADAAVDLVPITGNLWQFGRQLPAAKKRKDVVIEEPKRECHV
jgi:hypothetical protein